MTPQVLPHSHTLTFTHMSGALSQRPGLQLSWESSTSVALTFHCEVKGGDGVCVWGCVNEGQRDMERERKTKRKSFIVLARLHRFLNKHISPYCLIYLTLCNAMISLNFRWPESIVWTSITLHTHRHPCLSGSLQILFNLFLAQSESGHFG